MPFCGDGSLTGYDPDEIHVLCLRCKRWTCDKCIGMRLRGLKRLAQEGAPTKFITLTVNPSAFETPDDAAQALVRAWRATRQRARREGLADSIPFLAVFERTKAGWPHIHILARCPYIDQSWLSDRMAEYTSSPVVDIRAVQSARGAARYLGKYVSKGPGAFDRCKRYWCSRDWRLLPREDKPLNTHGRWWEIRKESMEEVVANILKCGWVHSSESPNAITLVPGPDAKYLWRCSGAGPPIE